jgi:hypothetical protein
MSNSFPDFDWDTLIKMAQDGQKGAGAMVEATRRFVQSAERYSKRIENLTLALVGLTIVLVILTTILVLHL